MAEDIDKEILANAQAEILAELYEDMQKKAFKPFVVREWKGHSALAESSKRTESAIIELLRSHLVNLFLDQYKSFGGDKQIDGVEYEGQFFGKGVTEATKTGREPVVIKLEDLPKALGFEKFLVKK